MTVSEAEIISLCARLSAHAGTLATDRPEVAADMRLAGRLLLRLVADGTVYGYVRLDPDDGGAS